MPGRSLRLLTCFKLISSVPVFDAWAVSAQLPVVQSLQDIGEPDEEPVIAMDAAHYLDQYRFPAKEPLVTALGGFPMNLESVIIKDIREIESFGCKTSFFFNGLDYGPDDEPFGPSMEAMSMNTKAFGVYENGDSFGAVDDFKLTGVHHYLFWSGTHTHFDQLFPTCRPFHLS